MITWSLVDPFPEEFDRELVFFGVVRDYERMTVLLVHVPVGFEEAYPLALAALAAPLRTAGYTVEGLDAARCGHQGLADRLARGDILWVGISVWSPALDTCKRLIETCRRVDPDIPVVVGGPHVTLRPDALDADCAVIGEGEKAAVEIADRLAAGQSLPKVWKRSHPLDLDNLPMPDREVFAAADYHRDHLPHGRRYASMVTSRGCRYRCAYCSAPSIWGKGHRRMSPARVVAEFAQLQSSYGIDGVLIEDDLFNQDRDHVEGVCDALLRSDLGVTWELLNGVRPDHLDPGLIRLMARAGLTRLALSLETASRKQLRKMGRSDDLEHVKSIVKEANDAGVGVTGYFMVGLPGETRSDRLRTFRWARSLRLGMAHFSVASAWPGTRWSTSELTDVPSWERSALYGAWYLNPRAAFRAARMLGVGIHDLPEMAHRLANWMDKPLEARRVESL